MIRVLRTLVVLLPLFALAGAAVWWLSRTTPAAAPTESKLLVIVVFDQMRGDYLERWAGGFGGDGFEKIKRDGAWYANCQLPYACSATGPGHASLVTGANPSVHGIIENRWYDRDKGKDVDAFSGDEPNSLVPDLNLRSNGLAPTRILAPTLSDALKDSTQGKGRLFSFALKERAAVLMGGKEPAGVYCFYNGIFHTSTFYRDRLPEWVDQFNKGDAARRWSNQVWDRFGKADYDKLAGPDNQPGEYSQVPTLPKMLPPANAGAAYFGAVEATPFGNELLWDFAKTAIAAEKLGANGTTDILCLSFSANDTVGHAFGPDSHETLDITLRSDKLVADMIKHLDETVGRDKFTLFITSDHGIAPLPEVAAKKHPEAGRIGYLDLVAGLDDLLDEKFGKFDGAPGRWVENVKGTVPWVYLNRKYIESAGLAYDTVEKTAAEWLANRDHAVTAFRRTKLIEGTCLPEEKLLFDSVKNAFHADRSGDIYIVPKPYLQLTGKLGLGVDHGSVHDYDRQVFLLVYGAKVPKLGKQSALFNWLSIAAMGCKTIGINPPAKAAKQLPEKW